MRKMAMAVLVGGGAVMGLAAPAHAAGCLSGAVVGGVAGHVAGHHGLLGAAAGCAIGHHEAVKHNREAAGERQGPDRQTYGRDAYRDDQPRN
jgi:hypothetical protein